MIGAFIALALVAPLQSNAALARDYAARGPGALARYYSALAATDLMPTVRSLGEGHSVGWAFFDRDPLHPILYETAPHWARLVKFDIGKGTIEWKAQLYPSSGSTTGVIDVMLRDGGNGAVHKSGSLTRFRTDVGRSEGLTIYTYQTATGMLTRIVYTVDSPKQVSTMTVRSDRELRKLGFS